MKDMRVAGICRRKKRDDKTPNPKPENLTPTPERKMGKRREKEARAERGTPALSDYRSRETSSALRPRAASLDSTGATIEQELYQDALVQSREENARLARTAQAAEQERHAGSVTAL